mgnify:CR=1 FL=1
MFLLLSWFQKCIQVLGKHLTENLAWYSALRGGPPRSPPKGWFARHLSTCLAVEFHMPSIAGPRVSLYAYASIFLLPVLKEVVGVPRFSADERIQMFQRACADGLGPHVGYIISRPHMFCADPEDGVQLW